jgi:uncharacterized protein
MTTLPVRRLNIDLTQPIPRHWCRGDAFSTAFFNALSMTFPRGEQYFMDSVRRAVAHLPADLPAAKRAAFDEEIRGFVGQEATHRHLHAKFNAHLTAQGLVNAWEKKAEARIALTKDQDPRHDVGITAALEHLTAMLSAWGLAHPEQLRGSDERVNRMWQWHFAEELEHRAVAFDAYLALGGNHEWRVRYFKGATITFARELTAQTWNNLRRDGTWWRPSTWVSAWRLLLGREGLLRYMRKPWRDYLQPSFHPSQHSGARGENWLEANSGEYALVGR